MNLATSEPIRIDSDLLSISASWDRSAMPEGVEPMLCAFLLDAEGRVPSAEHVVFDNHPVGPEGVVEHLGHADPDRETILLAPAGLLPNVDHVAVAVSVRHEYNAAGAWAAGVRIDVSDPEKPEREPMTVTMPSADGGSLVLAAFSRGDDAWQVRCLATSVPGAFSELALRYNLKVSTD